MENKKRKNEKVEISPTSKRLKIERAKSGLLDLSDDVLLHILQFNSHADLLSLNDTCVRLQHVSADESLWKRVSTKDTPLPPHRFRKMLKFLGNKTHSLIIGGQINPKLEVLTPSILTSISDKCPKLEEFSFESCLIDAEHISISQLPKSTKRLSLKNCQVVNIDPQKSYFYQMESLLPSLEFLDLTNCRWLSHHSLQAISKCQNLEKLILYGCRRIGECFVYTALATRFGFRKVSHLDLRNTNIGDSEVPCFGRLPNITDLFLGHTMPMPPSSRDSESNGCITDRGIISLCLSEMDDAATPGKLQRLSLIRTEVSDKCLSKLVAAFPSLQHLDLRGTQVTAKGVQYYLEKKPRCQILFE